MQKHTNIGVFNILLYLFNFLYHKNSDIHLLNTDFILSHQFNKIFNGFGRSYFFQKLR